VHRGLRRWLFGFAVGGAVTSLPWLATKSGIASFSTVDIVMLPGAVVALAFNGNVHDYSLAVLVVANVILYAIGTYFVLKFRGK
jgi:hypothetical protein